MSRHLNKFLLVLVVLAIGVVAACSGSTSTEDAGPGSPSEMTGG
jgi:hypothetical protein